MDGRVDVETYLREAHRAEHKIGSVYDSNVTAYDPFPGAPENRAGDPILQRRHRTDHERDGRLHHPPGRLENGRPLRDAVVRGEPQLGPRRHQRPSGQRFAQGDCQRSENGRADRPRLQRSVVSAFSPRAWSSTSCRISASPIGCNWRSSREATCSTPVRPATPPSRRPSGRCSHAIERRAPSRVTASRSRRYGCFTAPRIAAITASRSSGAVTSTIILAPPPAFCLSCTRTCRVRNTSLTTANGLGRAAPAPSAASALRTRFSVSRTDKLRSATSRPSRTRSASSSSPNSARACPSRASSHRSAR